MWITTTRFTDNGDPLPRRLALPELSKPVELTDSGKANVPADDAEYLIDNHAFEPVNDSEADEAADADADGDEADAEGESPESDGADPWAAEDDSAASDEDAAEGADDASDAGGDDQ